jgi:hypothetical protein
MNLERPTVGVAAIVIKNIKKIVNQICSSF